MLRNGIALDLHGLGRRTKRPVCDSTFYTTKAIKLLLVLFEYALKPPRMKGAGLDVLKDWGAPPETSEIFHTAKLPEFSSTNFVAPPATSKMRSGSFLPERVPTKKRKLNRESLYQLIPQVKRFPLSIQKILNQISPIFFRLLLVFPVNKQSFEHSRKRARYLSRHIHLFPYSQTGTAARG